VLAEYNLNSDFEVSLQDIPFLSERMYVEALLFFFGVKVTNRQRLKQ
jgi:hypothetical protein